ncbi:DUF4127 family protein [uncultured Anaerovibrio sp.]|uniref:DUF4127 family protein n=1 Tax=uncultured Anaerovibrio sp. TaxID=361586 RepID=UPI0025D8CCD4|nr:DUF4127 family protein [uncultured Anaerovibrio sp.]
MKKFAIIAVILISITGIIYYLTSDPHYDAVLPGPASTHKIILMPLDSRPPCTKLVADNARTAGITVITPPGQYMDFYTQPGDIGSLQSWLATELKSSQAEEAIVSIDQLLYGGLIASRNKSISDEDINRLVAYLRELHANNPSVKLYAFAILPRMTPPDYIEAYEDRQQLMEWSRRFHQYFCEPTAENYELLYAAEQGLSPAHLQAYQEVYERNLRLNCRLAWLMQEGVLHQLVLAQDDGEEYSLPNLKLTEFMSYVQEQGITTDRLAVIHGADEVALSILTNITTNKVYSTDKNRQKSFKVYLAYNSEDAAEEIMPYMAISSRETALERLAFTHSQVVTSVNEADYILFISCGSKGNMNNRRSSIEWLRKQADQGKHIALVDLSQKFSATEALFPLMLKENYPVNSLIAYAGWNTASNSIGTAIAQAEIYLSSLETASDKDTAVYYNLHNLNNRFLEDYYYLKDIIDVVNISLKKKGYANVYDLDLNHNYVWSADMLRSALNQRLSQYKYSHSFKAPFRLPETNTTYAVTDISMDAFFPWPRTFEINLDTALKIEKK